MGDLSTLEIQAAEACEDQAHITTHPNWQVMDLSEDQCEQQDDDILDLDEELCEWFRFNFRSP